MEGMSQRINDYLQSKIAWGLAWVITFVNGADGIEKKLSSSNQVTQESFLSLADWQIIVGIIFTSTMIIKQFYSFYKWWKERKRGDE